jgi:hypothetical protein
MSTQLDVTRLSKLCEMLRPTTSDGERANASAMATTLITKAGLTWTALIQAAERGLKPVQPQPRYEPPKYQQPRQEPPKPQPRREPPPTDSDNFMGRTYKGKTVPELLEMLNRIDGKLTPWEREFRSSLEGRDRASVKQFAVIQRIFDRVIAASKR